MPEIGEQRVIPKQRREVGHTEQQSWPRVGPPPRARLNKRECEEEICGGDSVMAGSRSSLPRRPMTHSSEATLGNRVSFQNGREPGPTATGFGEHHRVIVFAGCWRSADEIDVTDRANMGGYSTATWWNWLPASQMVRLLAKSEQEGAFGLRRRS
jgi:hypothetical protein